MSQEIITVESLKIDLFKNQYKQLASYMGDEEKAQKFLGSVAYCFQSVPKLADCERNSLMQAFMKIAEFNLFPSTVSGDAYVLPYKGKAQFQLGYKGIVKLLGRSGVVVTNSGIIREKDEYDVQEWTNPHIKHKIPMEWDRGKPIAVYVVVRYQWETIFKNMRSDEVLEFKKFSQSAGSDFSPWNPKADPELWMWRKTCLKQLSKTLPLNEETAQAIAYDNEESDIKEFQKDQISEKMNKESEVNINDVLK